LDGVSVGGLEIFLRKPWQLPAPPGESSIPGHRHIAGPEVRWAVRSWPASHISNKYPHLRQFWLGGLPLLWFSSDMAKEDVTSLSGMKFDDVLKKMLAIPPPANSKITKAKKPKKKRQ
jgi:hypothetical protein